MLDARGFERANDEGYASHNKIGAPSMSGRQLPIVLALGTTQTLAWASSVYLPALIADPIAPRSRHLLELDLRRLSPRRW